MTKYLLLFLLIPLALFSQPKNDSIQTLRAELMQLEKQSIVIDSLKRSVSALNEKYDHYQRITEYTSNGISSQIEAASYNLNIFGIAFTIFALVLGVYVTYVERKVVKIREDTQALLVKTNNAKLQVEDINNLIHEDIRGLYDKLKREETLYLLQRLVKVPDDVLNLSEQLLSRDLEREDFVLLREAYLKIKDIPQQNLGLVYVDPIKTYKLLFFQHFLDQAIKDEIICPTMIDYLPRGIDCSFKNDIIKSSEDFISAVVDEGIDNKSELINSFIQGLAGSHHKDDKDVYQAMFNRLKSRNNRFDFLAIILMEEGNKVSVVQYGELVENKYTDNLSASEAELIDKWRNLKEGDAEA